MKSISSIKLIYILPVFIILAQSCSDKVLDVDPRDRLTDETVWTDPGSADLFLNDVYTGLPDGNNWYDPIENWSDNSICGFAWPNSRTTMQQSLQSPVVTGFSGDVSSLLDWTSLYTKIRKCNVFIKNVTAAATLPDDFKKPKLAEARVLRAYFYHLLWMAYGGVPVITDVLDAETQGDAIFRPRNTADETYQFITKELDEVAADLPAMPSSGRMGKGAAWVLKGWCELFAGNYAAAVASNKKIMDELEYQLDPDYAALFLTKGAESKEAILYREYNPPGSGKGGRIDGVAGPTFTKGGAETSWGGVNPTQELVDEYAMANGKVITDPTSGYNPQKPYENREKRFYQSIVYDGSYFYNDTIYTRKGVGSKNEIDLTDRDDAGQTGYYLRKRLASNLVLGAASWDGYTSYQNYILFRFAEVLLNYAEAQNELAGADASVYDAVNRVRTRSGLSNLPAGLSKDQMRTAIRRERRVELAFEDKRYWDLIRWKIAEVNINRPLHGVSITKTGSVLSYTTIAARGGDRKFYASKNYLFPIPQTVIDKNPKLQGHQNPGY
ncbi:RagB/SusD family nutrient uptake outer membrane protein [Niabella beijingensis]|uniref:RagB/SusD family nutrient uptake outer membrane protein n=1 Tax=Niabella beijingensis TaxID=2872700 RepID=UPI001CBC5CF7|nr:RagB/SusD family nutrient uptake outer membrane protein [Niabella beijingensis]MBZ4191962.1 RagB/SusD family nutrient uptake outer membrane protein [Niabella beijingensis]